MLPMCCCCSPFESSNVVPLFVPVQHCSWSWIVSLALYCRVWHLPTACILDRLEINRHVIWSGFFFNVMPFPPSLQVFDGLGDLLMPAVTPQSTGGSTTGSAAGSMGTPVTVENIAAAPPATPPPNKTVAGDLDSSLANLVGGKFVIWCYPSLISMNTNVPFLLFFLPLDLGMKKK